MKKLLLIIFFVIFLTCHLYAKEEIISSANIIPTNNNSTLVNNALGFGYEQVSDFYQYVISPFNWKTDQWLTFAAISGITVGIIFCDKSIYNWAPKNVPQPIKDVFNFFYPLGSWTNMAYGLSALYAGSTIIQDKKLQKTSYLAMKSFIFTAGTTQALKTLFHRHFDATNDPYIWDGPKWDLNTDQRAFPGGHSATIWSVCTIFADMYSDVWWLNYLSYIAATCGSLASITRNEHWASDVFFGAAIGFFTAKSVVYLESQPQIFALPFLTYEALGIQCNYRF